MKPKIIGLQITTALFLHLFVFLMVMHSYCTGNLTVLLQPFYPVYAVKPFSCEYMQAEKILPRIDNESVFTVYTSFRENFVKVYIKRIPPFEHILIYKDEYKSFKTSSDREYVFGLFPVTAREPVVKVVETKSGDCDDFSTLLYIIYRLEGYDSHILLMTIVNNITGERIHHEVVVVKYHGKFYLFDTVNDFVVEGDSVSSLMRNYEESLMYYTITQYWFFDNRFLPHKNI